MLTPETKQLPPATPRAATQTVAPAANRLAQMSYLPAPAKSDTVALEQHAVDPAADASGAPGQDFKTKSIQGDMLEARLLATREWLSSQGAQTHSIQVLGSDNGEQLKQHLNMIAKSVEIKNVFVYRTMAKEKPFLTVLYGSFPSREAAQEALDRLPPPLRAFRPYLRTVQGIREEMSRNNTL
jgi:septal ring-binding cell division protein DamX